MLHFVLIHSVTCYTNSLISHIHVNNTNSVISRAYFGCHRCDTTEFRVYKEELPYFQLVWFKLPMRRNESRWQVRHSWLGCAELSWRPQYDRWGLLTSSVPASFKPNEEPLSDVPLPLRFMCTLRLFAFSKIFVSQLLNCGS
jgi:hypothetical protein